MPKYVMYKNEISGELVPLIFPDIVNHDDMSNGFDFALGEKRGEFFRMRMEVSQLNFVAVSAGFVGFNEHGKVFAYGKSESMQLESAEWDTAILQKFLQGE